jgi:hypothetical protein
MDIGAKDVAILGYLEFTIVIRIQLSAQNANHPIGTRQENGRVKTQHIIEILIEVYERSEG